MATRGSRDRVSMRTEPIADKVEFFDRCKENAVPAGRRDRLAVYWTRTLEGLKKVCEGKSKNENEITSIQGRDHEQAGREETGNEGTHGCHRPRRQGSGCFCARRESRWDTHCRHSFRLNMSVSVRISGRFSRRRVSAPQDSFCSEPQRRRSGELDVGLVRPPALLPGGRSLSSSLN